MKTPKVLTLKTADTPKYGVTAYGLVQSLSRPRLLHIVTREGRNNWACSCERHLYSRQTCDHIKQAKVVLARRKAA